MSSNAAVSSVRQRTCGYCQSVLNTYAVLTAHLQHQIRHKTKEHHGQTKSVLVTGAPKVMPWMTSQSTVLPAHNKIKSLSFIHELASSGANGNPRKVNVPGLVRMFTDCVAMLTVWRWALQSKPGKLKPGNEWWIIQTSALRVDVQ